MRYFVDNEGTSFFVFLYQGSKQMAFIRDITISMKAGEYDKADKLSRKLIELSLKGLNYYHNYDRVLLSCVVTLGFLGWIGCVILQIFPAAAKNSLKTYKWNSLVNKIFAGIGCAAVVLLRIKRAPITHYLYCLLPLACWNYVAQQWTTIKGVFGRSCNNTVKLFISLLVVIFGLEVLLISFFHRYTLSVGLIFLAAWPLVTPLAKTHAITAGLWALHCLTLAVFPLLPVVGRESNYRLVTMAGILSFVEALMVIYFYKKNTGVFSAMTKIVLVFQFLIMLSAITVLNHSTYCLSLKRGIPLLNQIFSWSTLICCLFLPTLITDTLVLRLLSTVMSLLPVYLLLSTSYEALFFLILSSTMALWLTLEHQLSSFSHDYCFDTPLTQVPVHDMRNGNLKNVSKVHDVRDSHTCNVSHNLLNDHAKKASPVTQDPRDGHEWKVPAVQDTHYNRARKLSFDDIRCSFFFLYFIMTAFFGTGNIASINSFDPATIYCFLTVFSPFIMGSLLMLKILIPFIVVTCVFDAVHMVCGVPLNRLFVLVLVMADFLALQFFFLVQDYGSWLEIGTSISHFVIMLLFIIYLFFIFGVARYFTRHTWWNSVKSHIQ